MKIFLLLALPIFLIGCDRNPVPTVNQTEYEIEIIIDGVTNRVHGTLSDKDYWDFDTLNLTNIPMTFIGLSKTNLVISDSTNNNLIEGYPSQLGLTFNPNKIGEIPVAISLYHYGSGFYSEKYPGLNIRTNPLNQYLVADTMIDWVSFKSIKQYKPDSNSLKLGTIFTLTDLGTDPTAVLPEGYQSGDILRQGEYEVKFGVTQKGFMNKTQLFFVEAHYIKDGKDVIKWSAPIDVEFRFKAFRRLY